MKTQEFTIRVSKDDVEGLLGVCGEQPEVVTDNPCKLSLDPLTLKTVDQMNRWLRFWHLIEDSQLKIPRMKRLLQPDTLELLGEHLWRLILDNDVGRALKEAMPKKNQPPLRLSLEFTEAADDRLKGLPWEFLYEPEKGWWLATKTELLLTRYVEVENKPERVAQASEHEKLRVLLIAALPDRDEFAVHSKRLRKLRDALENIENLEVPDPIESWNKKAIEDKLASDTYHIVHVVGICKGEPGKAQIYLGGGPDGFEDPIDFVEALTKNAMRPGLVILQLCDFVDGDATENFERIAPALIKSKVPAVLALQYAAMAEPDRIGLGAQFYQSLVDGLHVGAAVQASRANLQSTGRDRRFGTPVLYLQDDLAVRRRIGSTKTSTVTAQAGTSERSVGKREFDALKVRNDLIKLVQEKSGEHDLGASEETEILVFVWTLDLLTSFDAIKVAIKKQMRESVPASYKDIYRDLLSRVGELDDHVALRSMS